MYQPPPTEAKKEQFVTLVTSHMTLGQTFLFTDWAFEVDEVVKDNPKARLAALSLRRHHCVVEPVVGQSLVACIHSWPFCEVCNPH